MAGTSDGGGEYHQLDESQRLLLDVMTTQMQCLLNCNNEKLYRRIPVWKSFTEKQKGSNSTKTELSVVNFRTDTKFLIS